MKGILFLLPALVISTFLFAQTDFIIQGRLKRVDDGIVISLMKPDGNVSSQVATDTIRRGRFLLRYPGAEQAEPFSLSCFEEGFPSMRLSLYARSGAKIRIKGKGKRIKTWAVRSDIPEQKEYNRFIAENRKEWEELQDVQIALQGRRAYRSANRDKLSEQASRKLQRAFDSLYQQSDVLQKKITRKEVDRLQEWGVSEVGLPFLEGAARHVKYQKDSMLFPVVAALYAQLPEVQRQSVPGKAVHHLLYPPRVVQKGEPLADADLFDLQGNTHRLADFRGKYLLLDFWSIGCGPCIAAGLELGELSSDYKDRLEVIGISLDTRSLWSGLSMNKKISWTNLSDGKQNTGIAARYGVEGIPHYTLISPDGIVVDSWVGYGKGSLIAKIKEHIGE